MEEPRNMFPEGTNMRKVIDYATKEFFTKGIKLVTMDDIAKGLQMSKRTLYQLFADKEQLIIACLEVNYEEEKNLTCKLINEGYNVLEIILRAIEHNIMRLQPLSIQYIKDLGRYKAVKEYIHLSRQESIKDKVMFFVRGVDQGIFRNDVNFEILMRTFYSQLDTVVHTLLFEEFSIQDCFINIGLFHLRGCCTPRGIELIDNFLEHYREEMKEK